ncbi:DEAD/DEAH box helicase [Tengunoibacter tsumagoiensis]|uniref:ATP-dependent helicase n=1 Tax=Tengunoibacter tsumagoiensis TaxID=2014871 RepID=A0A401ZWX6_9CHLR|nr:DEAD/DEAH box helicase [Tengunoibacter tsumagoiensis]GCE11367.1 ATP-dependent helicase [Tengunoibacter tsumagoiensis]
MTNTITTINLRGRDLIITPPSEWQHLSQRELMQMLFGQYLPGPMQDQLKYDHRSNNPFLRSKPVHFTSLKQALRQQQVPFTVTFEELPTLPVRPQLTMQPRPYQAEAIAAWLKHKQAGVVVLPTGAGKTFVAAMAIAETQLWTLAVVPTIDLLQQWQTALASALSLPIDEIGTFGGGEKELKPITIITYDSAALYPRELARFGLLIFDECHHLPAPTYRLIAESSFTPYRLGLSATPERGDMAHLALDELIGPELYRRSPAELMAGNFLADYQEHQVDIALSPADEKRYAEQRRIYRSFLQRNNIVIRSPEDFQQKLIYLTARNPEARAAMLAWREARNIAMNAPAKYHEIERLLQLHANDQVILFSEYNQVVDEISRRFCLPSITYKTPAEERRTILDRFRSGTYTKLVTGRVLNEGVDVPDCRVAIIVSGNSTKREYIQRLGRILRPKVGQAQLYELITSKTTEEEIAKRRR